jgi:hypothetical protein
VFEPPARLARSLSQPDELAYRGKVMLHAALGTTDLGTPV